MNKDILSALKKKYNNNAIRLPKNIWVNETTDGSITMLLSAAAVGLTDKPLNMQCSNACFEGWAAAIYYAFDKNRRVYLDVAEEYLPEASLGKYGHYNRFLYRAMKFSEQYPWFELSDKLKDTVSKFKNFLYSTGKFVNNIACNVAEENDHLENKIENSFVKNNADYLKSLCVEKGYQLDEKLYSQLPVGLFFGTKSEHTSIFTGKKSAIDIWNITGDTINIFELKYNNKMVGAITEMFFYANYILDFYVNSNNFKPLPVDSPISDELRGYEKLTARNFVKINAFLLADENGIHPLLTQEIFELLCSNGLSGKISYDYICYDEERVLKEEKANK